MEIWTEEHARVVAQAAPPVEEADLDRTWDMIRSRMDGPTPDRRRRKRARMALGAGVVVAAVGLSGVAAADILTARTGNYPVDAEDLRLGGPGEELDPAASDFGDVIAEETRDIPFPTEAARRISLASHVQDAERSAPAPRTESVTTGALRAWTAVHAVCAWANEWVRAGRAGDDLSRSRAARMLIGARHWSAITDIDPVQHYDTLTQDVLDPATGLTTTETIPDPTQFYYLKLVSAAVAADDVDTVAALLADNAYCIGRSLLPDFPRALPPGFRGR